MRRIAIILSGLLFTVLLCGGLLAGVGSAQTTETETNASFGAEVSSFMQASEAEAANELDDRMFEAALNRTTDPEERRTLLEERQQRLEERSRELQTRREALDGASNVRGHAIATRIAVGSIGLERSVNETERTATEVGMNTTRLEAIRSNARELRGQEVAELARGFAGPPEGRRGPPENERGPPERAPDGNRSTGSQPEVESSSVSMPTAPPIDRPADRDNRSGGPSEGSEAPDVRPSTEPNGGGGDTGDPTGAPPSGENSGSSDGKKGDSPGPPDEDRESPPSETGVEDNDTERDPADSPGNGTVSGSSTQREATE
jgi:hypothetical protein